jgi:hypothetical protein
MCKLCFCSYVLQLEYSQGTHSTYFCLALYLKGLQFLPLHLFIHNAA